MKVLLLNGHGINFKVNSAKLIITNGRTSSETPEQYVFKPKKIDYDNIVVYGQNGNISIDAIRWLTKHNVQITILNWNGKILTTMLPPESVEVKTKFAQYKAYEKQETRLPIAKQILSAKFERTKEVLQYLKERYPHIDTDFSEELKFFKEANSIKDLLMVEGRIARHYWTQIRLIIPNKYDFEGRHTQNHPRASGDMVNTILNYSYSLLEAECLRAINSTGLDAHIGFLHEQCIGKNSLAYDLQELYRYLIDLVVIDLIEKDVMKKSDFVRTENYNLRLKPCGTKKITEAINKKFAEKISYKNKQCNHTYVLLLKTRELQQHLNKNTKIDLTTPKTKLKRIDSQSIREKILSISYVEWAKLGFSKGTLHYLKQNAKLEKPFTINKHILDLLTN